MNISLPQSLDPLLPTMFLDEYSDFADVFEKKGVETLLPYCPYDCPIDLILGKEEPFRCIYAWN